MRVSNLSISFVVLILVFSCTTRDSTEESDAKKSIYLPPQSLSLVEGEETRTPDEIFCAGFKEVLKITKQPIADYYSEYCSSDTTLTTTFKDLLALPYRGENVDDSYTLLKNDYNSETKTIEVKVAYVIEIDKKSVPLLLAEEPFIQNTNYEESPGKDDFGLALKFNFIDPPANVNDCDTAMRVVQTTSHDAKDVIFSERSVHDLKLYRMQKNKFDYLMAARTLDASQPDADSGMDPLFETAIAIRGVMPASPTTTYSLTLIHFKLDRSAIKSTKTEVPEELRKKVQEFMLDDMRNLYKHHQ